MVTCLAILVKILFFQVKVGINFYSGNHDSIKAIGQNVPSKEDEFASSIVPSGNLVKYEKVGQFRSRLFLIQCLAGSLPAFVQRIRRLRDEADRNSLRRKSQIRLWKRLRMPVVIL